MAAIKKTGKTSPRAGEPAEDRLDKMIEPATIDRDKLRAAIRRLGPEHVFYMLDDAIDLLPLAELEGIAKKYLDIRRLRPDGDSQTKATLLADVRSFDKASRAGEYYESFMVNSRNYTAQSTGTTAWIATCNRLLDCCVANEKKSDAAEIRAAFDILFGLLDYIDQGNDDVIFFADEGGSWQVGVDWVKILPSWFRVLSITATPKEYAERITSLIRHHCDYDRDKILAAASASATAGQREALAKIPDRQARGQSQFSPRPRKARALSTTKAPGPQTHNSRAAFSPKMVFPSIRTRRRS